jgi:type II secretion system protein H
MKIQPRKPAGFTLIEIMMVVGLIGIMFTVGIPTFAKAHNQRPMRVATEELMEILHTARAQAIIQGATVELRINPQEYTFNVSVTGQSTELVERVESGSAATGKGRFQAKLPAEVGIELLDVNFVPYRDEESAVVHFYSNGTSEEFSVVIQSLQGEYRRLFVDPITGRANYEVIK